MPRIGTVIMRSTGWRRVEVDERLDSEVAKIISRQYIMPRTPVLSGFAPPVPTPVGPRRTDEANEKLNNCVQEGSRLVSRHASYLRGPRRWLGRLCTQRRPGG